VAPKSARDLLNAEFQNLSTERRSQLDAVDVSEPSRKRAKHHFDDDDLDALAGMASSKAPPTDYERWIKLEDVVTDDVLVWWKGHESDFPLLAVLARRYLAIPASSASSERVFSVLKSLATEKRVRMSPETLCQLLFVKSTSHQSAKCIQKFTCCQWQARVQSRAEPEP
jgi:hypothetical protein